MHVRKDDMVEVICGDDAEKGRARKVLRILPEVNKVVVEGVNRVYKHVKARASRHNPQGGRLSKEMPVAASNILLFCPACKHGVRIGRRYLEDGRKERFCKKCSVSLGVLSRSRTRCTPRSRSKLDLSFRASRSRDEINWFCCPLRTESVMARLQERYQKEIVQQLATKFNRTNVLSLPRLQKICVNMGVGKALQDKNRMEQAADQLSQITGQKSQVRKAKVAVSGFRLRENQEIGCRVTLRGLRKYEFLDRLISVSLPRIRDFRGVNPKSFDGHGNYSLGLTEQAVFPEIDPDKVSFSQGMDITFVTSTDNDDEARELLRAFGMPFREA